MTCRCQDRRGRSSENNVVIARALAVGRHLFTRMSLKILGQIKDEYKVILTPEALNFLKFLHISFDGRRKALLERRVREQAEINRRIFPTFPPEMEAVRSNPVWKGAPPAPGLVDRRVEITGPVDRKMVVNALNSGATQFMADFEGTRSSSFLFDLISQILLHQHGTTLLTVKSTSEMLSIKPSNLQILKEKSTN